jgi:putative flavoprotein involved in K+ transport
LAAGGRCPGTQQPAFEPAALEGAHRSVVVIGAGQAGLSRSWWLTRAGLEHVVLEAERVGHEWADRRWDSFCRVTPKLSVRIAGLSL